MIKKISLIIAFFSVTYIVHAQELSLDKILEEYYQENAFDKLQKVKTIIMSGSITRNDLMPYKITKMRPDKFRLDFQVADLEAIQAYDGKNAWSTAPWTGNPKPTLMNEDATGGMSLRADFDGIIYKWKEKGHKAELSGKEMIGNKEAYKINLTRKDGGKEVYFIDTMDFMLLKQLSYRKIRGQDVEVEVYYTDYKKIEGIPFAFVNETKMGGQPYSLIEFETIQLNLSVDAKIFVMPEN